MMAMKRCFSSVRAKSEFQKGVGILLDKTNDRKHSAIVHFTAAAEEGDVKSQHALGMIYLNGTIATKNALLAHKYLSSAAEQDHPNSCHQLGRLFHEQDNFVSAFEWWERAAVLNHPIACFDLGHCYEYGLPPLDTRDYDKSYHYYQQALKLDPNLPQALHAIGCAWLKGRGRVEDATKGVSFLEKAAQNGSIQAHFDLGACYMMGRGTTKNVEKAKVCFFLAAQGGISQAQEILDQL